MEYLQREVWPHIPPEDRGKVMTKQEEEEILGIGPNGYPE
jgi:antitoxin VapB